METARAPAVPPRDCPLCPRLAAFRRANAAGHPDWFNGAVPDFGDPGAWLLIVGLAPGLRGANRTGRPFTGDDAGGFLYDALARAGLAAGRYGGEAGDGLTLRGVMVTNAVRCVPPANRPTAAEIARCRPFLAARLAALPRLRAVLTLGRIAHDSTVRALGLAPRDHPFAHGGVTEGAGLTLLASYHCSRLNTNTGRLTEAMFDAVLAEAIRRRPV